MTKVEFWQEAQGVQANALISAFEADDLLAASIQEGVQFKLRGVFWIVEAVHREIEPKVDDLVLTITTIQALVRRTNSQRGIQA